MIVTKYIVTYQDRMLGGERNRVHNDLESALEFIKNRATMPHLYNEFLLDVQMLQLDELDPM